jgi:hypothetical protein
MDVRRGKPEKGEADSGGREMRRVPEIETIVGPLQWR